MNVEDYLTRIGCRGFQDREPNLETLGKLTMAHKNTVPYSNLSMFRGKPIKLQLEYIYEKIVTNRGGGICIEIDALFSWLLRELGFKVIWGEAAYHFVDRFTVQDSHLIIIVDFGDQGHYFIDPGWETVIPMKMQHMVPHLDAHYIFRFRPFPGRDHTWWYLEKHKKSIIDKDGDSSKCYNIKVGRMIDE